MGGLTPSFRIVYHEVLEQLRKEIRDSFVDVGHKEAFDLLYKKAWYPEEAAMGQSTLPAVLDKLVIVGNIHNLKLISELSDQIKDRGARIENLSNQIKLLEESSLKIHSSINKIYAVKESSDH